MIHTGLCDISMVVKCIQYMDGVVREVNAREWAETAECECGRFEINQLLFADDAALVADSEEKLCKQASKFGRVGVRRKVRWNVGNSKVMRYSRYVNWSRMYVRLNANH